MTDLEDQASSFKKRAAYEILRRVRFPRLIYHKVSQWIQLAIQFGQLGPLPSEAPSSYQQKKNGETRWEIKRRVLFQLAVEIVKL